MNKAAAVVLVVLFSPLWLPVMLIICAGAFIVSVLKALEILIRAVIRFPGDMIDSLTKEKEDGSK